MKLQTVTSWHKILGMTATIFIVVLSITGFLLLHTDDLRLQDKLIINDLLLDWYEIKPEQPPRTFNVRDQWITQIDHQVYFERISLGSNQEELKGAVSLENFHVLAYEDSIDLLTTNGDFVERLTGVQGIPQGIENIAAGNTNSVYVKTRDGTYVSGPELINWQITPDKNIIWAEQARPPDLLIEELLQLYRGSGLPLERVILDLHSGRILGKPGIWIVDISVLIFLALSISGWWAWFKRRALQKQIDEEY